MKYWLAREHVRLYVEGHTFYVPIFGKTELDRSQFGCEMEKKSSYEHANISVFIIFLSYQAWSLCLNA